MIAGSSDSTRRILVVDDEKVLAGTLVQVLEAGGYAAKAVHNAEDALKSVDEFQPHVVISDVIMPGTNGIELARQIRQRCPDCAVLLFSGNATTQELLDEARAKGLVLDVLAKPVHPRLLLEKIDTLFRG